MNVSNQRFVSALERLLAANRADYFSAYDDFLWCVATARYDELQIVVANLWDTSYDELPIPLSVVICRLYLNEAEPHNELVKCARDFISAHCSPGEAEGALGYRKER